MRNSNENRINIKKIRNELPEITGSVFFLTVVAFFLSSLMSTLGSVIDAFIIGHTMRTTDVGALSLTSPIWFVMAIIYGILAIGSQPFCSGELGRGNKEAARKIFSMTLITGIGITLLFSLLIFAFGGVAAGLLGAPKGMPEHDPCRRYLIGTAWGFPALAAISLLSTGINLEGARRWTFYSAAVVTVSNILLDLVVAWTHGDILMMGLTTSISYYFGAGVLVLYYFKEKDVLLRPMLCRVSPRLILKIAGRGMPLGVSRITRTVKTVYLNHLLASTVTSAGLAAYNVQVQINYLTNNLFMSIAQTMTLMLCIYYAEEDRRGMRHTALIALGYEFFFGAAIMMLLRNPDVTRMITWFYLGGADENTFRIAEIAIYFFAEGLIGQAVSVLFANYLQSIGRTAASNIVYVLCDVFLVILVVTSHVRALSPGVSDMVRSGSIFAGVSEAMTSMLFVIPFMILLIIVIGKIRPRSFWDAALMLPRSYGVSRDQELTESPRTLEEISEFSRNANTFCLKHGAGRREAYYIALAAEEMANNVLKHGFTDRGFHSMELRVICKENALFLRIRDNSHVFDPIKKMAEISENKDPAAYIGLKMVMRLASEVVYTSALKLNNLLIRVDIRSGEDPAAGI